MIDGGYFIYKMKVTTLNTVIADVLIADSIKNLHTIAAWSFMLCSLAECLCVKHGGIKVNIYIHSCVQKSQNVVIFKFVTPSARISR